MLDSVKGNFTHVAQREGKFPIDAETFEYIKNNATLMAALGNALGENFVILNGCTVSGNTRSEGYVYVRLTPEGEILHFPGGNANQAYCHIQSSPVDVTAHGEPYSGAYNVRSLANGMHPSDSSQTMQWANFKIGSEIFARKSHTHTIADILNLQTELDKKLPITTHNTDLNNINTTITKLQNQVNNYEKTTNNNITNINNALTAPAVAFVVGMIIMWSGRIANIPQGWHLCDGKDNTPDLRGHFIIGSCNESIANGVIMPFPTYLGPDTVATYVGMSGGKKSRSITLEERHMPKHTHEILVDGVGGHNHGYFYYEEGTKSDAGGKAANYLKELNLATSTTDNAGSHTHTARALNTGGGESFTVETLPPYYSLAFIMYKGV